MTDAKDLTRKILTNTRSTKSELALATLCNELISKNQSCSDANYNNRNHIKELANEIKNKDNEIMNMRFTINGLEKEIERLKGWINGRRDKEPNNNQFGNQDQTYQKIGQMIREPVDNDWSL